MSFGLLGVDSILEYLSQTTVIIGITLLIIGLAIAMLSKRIARVARKSNDVRDDDRITLVLRVIGLLFIVAGFIVSVIQ